MNEPRPAMISARPPESRSSVAKSWKTRTGSSELSTETALVRRMRSVRSAAAGSTGAGVLAAAEEVEPDLVGQLDLLEQIAQAPAGADHRAALDLGGQLREGVDA